METVKILSVFIYSFLFFMFKYFYFITSYLGNFKLDLKFNVKKLLLIRFFKIIEKDTVGLLFTDSYTLTLVEFILNVRVLKNYCWALSYRFKLLGLVVTNIISESCYTKESPT